MVEKPSAIIRQIVQIVKQILTIERDIDIDEDLSELGLHSFASINLLIELENKYDFVFEDEELLLDHFKTIRGITGIVLNKIERDDS